MYPHLSALPLQQSSPAENNLTDLPPFGNSKSNKVKFLGITSYGNALECNKIKLYNAATAFGANNSERALIIAMAMVKPQTICDVASSCIASGRGFWFLLVVSVCTFSHTWC